MADDHKPPSRPPGRPGMFADVPRIDDADLRRELAEELDAMLLDDFRENGRAWLARLRQKSPAKYGALIAGRAGWTDRTKPPEASPTSEATFLALLRAIGERRIGKAADPKLIEGQTVIPPRKDDAQ